MRSQFFGPGYGECCVLHLGDGVWLVVDSCINTASKRPVSLEYLESIGVDPSSVQLVVATHWHDDHVRGMAAQLKAFSKARFCSSSALTNKEFLASVVAYEQRHNIAGGSGASELTEVLEVLRSRSGKSSPIKAFPGRQLMTLAGTPQLPERVVRTLSPSDKQLDLFLLQIAALLPAPLQTRTRVPDQSPNNLSIAMHVAIGDQAILLGADLEEHGDAELGWAAIVLTPERPTQKAQIFKVPHHGSQNGHSDGVWQQMLVKDALSIVTPWNRNNGLPQKEDVTRICGLTNAAFCTSSTSASGKRHRPYSVEKQIKETVGNIRSTQQRTGWVRLRNGGVRNPTTWSLELSSEACSLKDWRAA
ncbi:MBL fold metallo-hydrolase [Bradyrhizobium elkanii]|nr:MBL fold metallo-hydrolase [Bradyrhizobium elkanii]